MPAFQIGEIVPHEQEGTARRHRPRRAAEHLGHLLGHGAGVAVGRLGGGQHEIGVADLLGRSGQDLGRGERIGAGQVGVRICLGRQAHGPAIDTQDVQAVVGQIPARHAARDVTPERVMARKVEIRLVCVC